MILRWLGLSIAALLLGGAVASAQRLQIVDHRGLVRAQRDLVGPAIIQVQLVAVKGRMPSVVRLQSVDGVTADVVAEVDQDGKAKFSGVAPGTWRLSNGSTLLIGSVVVKDRE